jgi:NADH-quinone oxidoreductase subunit L
VPGWIASAAILGSFLASIGAFAELLDRPEDKRSLVDSAFAYVHTAGVSADVSILIDPLSVFMCLVVSGVSFLIHVYSVAYMDSDRGYARYFAYLNYFVFSMLLLVLAANFVLLIVGWAFVGAASYLLISFWYRRTTATYAGIKAFVINVIGDVGLVIAVFLLFDQTGALDYKGVFANAHEVFAVNDGTLIAACLLILVGAFAKSAQLPLHTWLPDAMEGPTPVSALIHAATMVTAGVYLIARTHPLFELAPTAADVSAIIGTATLLFAATVALAVTDLKRIIAYSTISQIGYMVLGVSVAAYGAGLFHLMTHAFFKALLFMGAGSVIGAMSGNQSIDRMGGFRKAMPFTFATFTVGALALSGFPLMSGFFSKDEILAFTMNRGGGYWALAVAGYLAAGLTAFYAFRMVFRVFFRAPVPEARELEHGHLAHGDPENPATGESEDTDVGFPGPEHHIAERSWPMRAAMGPLALLSLVGGIVGVPYIDDALEKFLEPTFADSRFKDTVPTNGAELSGLGVGGMVAILAIALAYVIYIQRRPLRLELRERFDAVHTFLFRKWYFDELYEAVFVRPTQTAADFGRRVIETDFVQGVIVGGATGVVRTGTSVARAVQTGYLRAYALLLLVGVGALALYFLITSS